MIQCMVGQAPAVWAGEQENMERHILDFGLFDTVYTVDHQTTECDIFS